MPNTVPAPRKPASNSGFSVLETDICKYAYNCQFGINLAWAACKDKLSAESAWATWWWLTAEHTYWPVAHQRAICNDDLCSKNVVTGQAMLPHGQANAASQCQSHTYKDHQLCITDTHWQADSVALGLQLLLTRYGLCKLIINSTHDQDFWLHINVLLKMRFRRSLEERIWACPLPVEFTSPQGRLSPQIAASRSTSPPSAPPACKLPAKSSSRQRDWWWLWLLG